MKAFRLRGDKESLKSMVCECFSGAAVFTAKLLLWDSCAEALRSLNLPFQQRRDSDKRKQITADVEDLLLAGCLRLQTCFCKLVLLRKKT